MDNPHKELVLEAIGIILENRLVSRSVYPTSPEDIYKTMVGRQYLGSERANLVRGEGMAHLRGMTATLLWKRKKLKLSSPKVAEMVGYTSHASVIESRDRHMTTLESIIKKLNLKEIKKVRKIRKSAKIEAINKREEVPKEPEVAYLEIPSLRQTRPLYDDGQDDYIPWSGHR